MTDERVVYAVGKGSYSDDERDLAQALFRTLYDAGVSFRSGELIPRLVAAVRDAGFRRPGAITDEVVEAAARALAETFGDPPYLPWEGWGELSRDEFRADARAALEAAEHARSAVPSTTEQESGDA